MIVGSVDVSSVAGLLCGDAAAVVCFGRDETDSFQISIEAHDSTLAILQNRDVLPFLPKGTRWRHLIGWSSVIGLPVQLAGRKWAMLGIEWIEAHPTRGAFPRLVGAFHDLSKPEQISRTLEAAAHALAPAPSHPPKWTYGTRNLGAIQPSALAAVHADFLLRAADAYRTSTHLLFRSVLLAEEDVPEFVLFKTFGRQDNDNVLLGVVPSIVDTFSLRARARLLLNSTGSSFDGRSSR